MKQYHTLSYTVIEQHMIMKLTTARLGQSACRLYDSSFLRCFKKDMSQNSEHAWGSLPQNSPIQKLAIILAILFYACYTC